MIIEFIILFKKFTQSINLDTKNLEIIYFRFFTKKHLKIPVDDLELKLIHKASFRGGEYVLVKVYSKKKIVYSFDSIDGFSEYELMGLVASLGNSIGD